MSAEGFLRKCGFEQTSENIGVRDFLNDSSGAAVVVAKVKSLFSGETESE
jgi:hypothetical protein